LPVKAVTGLFVSAIIFDCKPLGKRAWSGL
jgi:hypothetical protein